MQATQRNNEREQGGVWAIVVAADRSVVPTNATNARQAVLLSTTIDRALRLTQRDRVVVVLPELEVRGAREALFAVAEQNVLREPEAKGTAPRVLLATLHILARDPTARIIVLPVDHVFTSEDRFQDTIARAVDVVGRSNNRPVLLGMRSFSANGDLPWVLAGTANDGAAHVDLFLTEPGDRIATTLFERGALRSASVLVGTPSSLLRIFEHAVPKLVRAFLKAQKSTMDRAALYAGFAAFDFSADVLELAGTLLSVIEMPRQTWSVRAQATHTRVAA